MWRVQYVVCNAHQVVYSVESAVCRFSALCIGPEIPMNFPVVVPTSLAHQGTAQELLNSRTDFAVELGVLSNLT